MTRNDFGEFLFGLGVEMMQTQRAEVRAAAKRWLYVTPCERWAYCDKHRVWAHVTHVKPLIGASFWLAVLFPNDANKWDFIGVFETSDAAMSAVEKRVNANEPNRTG